MNPEPQGELVRKDPPWGWTEAALFLAAVPVAALIAFLPAGILMLTKAQPVPFYVTALVTQAVLYIVLLGALALVLRSRGRLPFWRSLEWNPVGAGQGLMLLLGGVLVAITIGIIGAALRTPNIDAAFRILLEDKLSITLLGLFAIVLGPIFEELLFRGFFLPLLVARFGAAVGVLVVSLPFALLHGKQYEWSWRHILMLTIASCAFGVVRLLTGSTLASTLVHAGYNAAFYTGYLLNRKDLPL